MSFTAPERVLQELGITEPEQIDLEAVAWHLGASVKYKPLDGCEARIVGHGSRAIITVNEASAPVRKRFSLGHEIGHWCHHSGQTLVCRSEEIGRHGEGGAYLERQADAFAAELLLPSYILCPYVRQFRKLNFEVIRKIAALFSTSLPATAIKMVEKDFWPSILICHAQIGRRWFVRNLSVSRDWFPRSDLDPQSHAFGLVFGNGTDQSTPRTVKASLWFDRRDAERYELQEQSVRMTDGDVLSLLLVTDPRMIDEQAACQANSRR